MIRVPVDVSSDATDPGGRTLFHYWTGRECRIAKQKGHKKGAKRALFASSMVSVKSA